MDKFNIVIGVVNVLILAFNVFIVVRGQNKEVEVGREVNSKTNRDNAKHNLFLTLFSYRGSPININFVTGLNQIDIVFHDNPDVLKAWHELYNSLNLKNQVDEATTWKLLRADLLSEMAAVLGYPKIKQTDILKHYYPEGYENQDKFEMNFREAQYAYYRSGTAMNTLIYDQNVAASKDSQPEPDKG